MITYNDIYTILRNEKYNELLQKLPNNFLFLVREYFEDKEKIIKKHGDSFDEAISKLKKQLENAKSLINELFLIRQKKILNLAILAKISGVTKSDIQNMLDEEKELFESTLNKLKETEKLIKRKLSGKKKNLKKNLLVRFKQAVPPFLDEEGNKLGPFEKGDIVSLPKEIVRILELEDKVAVLDQ